jgi:hypothetical protein
VKQSKKQIKQTKNREKLVKIYSDKIKQNKIEKIKYDEINLRKKKS